MLRSLFLFVFFYLGNVAFSQSTESRVQQIRGMYESATNYFSRYGMNNCRSVRGNTQENGHSFTQKIKRCSYPESYSIVFGEFDGWEWGANINYYYKNGSLFFVLVKYEGICGSETNRIYYGSSGNVIRVLTQEDNDCEDVHHAGNVDVTGTSEASQIVSFANKQLRYANSVLR